MKIDKNIQEDLIIEADICNQKYRIGIQSERIRAIPKSVSEPFRVIPNQYVKHF